MAKEFAEFVRKEAQEAARSEIDWQAKKDIWLKRLDDLYRRVEDYLDEFTKDGLITVERAPAHITEQYIGSYSTDRLILQIGKKQAELRPIGTLLIGSAGRVDLTGPSGSARIVLAPREVESPRITSRIRLAGEPPEEEEEKAAEPDWVWKLVVYDPSMRYLMLDRETFQSALMAVANA
ncbi:MAG TPA: hypothetical protein VF582_03125 [Allosphingosinicella sp.]